MSATHHPPNQPTLAHVMIFHSFVLSLLATFLLLPPPQIPHFPIETWKKEEKKKKKTGGKCKERSRTSCSSSSFSCFVMLNRLLLLVLIYLGTGAQEPGSEQTTWMERGKKDLPLNHQKCVSITPKRQVSDSLHVRKLAVISASEEANF